MDIGQIGDDGWASVRAAWREERWLPAGLAVGAVAYALWIGVTGAALSFFADATAGTVTLSPWTSLSTVAVAVVAVVWILGPAALVTVLVVDRVTNVNDNLAVGYRLRHPILLLGPPGLILAVGLGLLVGPVGANPAVLAVLAVGAVWLAVRTTAYAYRVFALSLPVVAWALLFATAATIASAVLVLGGVAVGRDALVAAVSSGLARATGIDVLTTVHTTSYAVDGVAVPLPVAAAVAVPVGGTALYLAVQLPWSVVSRLRRPTVRRPQLRTGQRYPRFARPTTAASPAGVGAASETPTPTGGTAAAADSDPADGTGSPDAAGGPDGDAEPATDPASPGSDDELDDVTHTRVFTPPDDADVEGVDGLGGGDGVTSGRETTITDDPDEGYCPGCGAAVDRCAATCPDCGADLAAN